MKAKISKLQERKIKENLGKMTQIELASKMGISYGKFKGILRELKLVNRRCGDEIIKRGCFDWSVFKNSDPILFKGENKVG